MDLTGRITTAFKRRFGKPNAPLVFERVAHNVWRARDTATGAVADYDTGGWRIRRIGETDPTVAEEQQ